MRTTLLTVVLATAAVGAAPATAQSITPPPQPRVVELAGPRFGLTVLPDSALENLRERQVELRPLITQFGWQFEREFYSNGSGVAALNEWVVLLGGLDQGVALPSVSWLVGLRTHEGTEFGLGPNVSPGGVALALAAGVTLRTGIMNVPLNVAIVPAKTGTRVSVLTGFTLRRP